MVEHTSLTEKFEALRPVLNELARRRWAATEARAFGRGGISAVARATGLSRKTIRAGMCEMQQDASAASVPETARMRRPGAGRKRRATEDPTLLGDLETLVEPTTRGDPQSPLRWTCKSVRRLAAELKAEGHQLVRSWSVSCSTPPVTACREHARRAKAPSTRIATPSSSTSPPGCATSSSGANRSSRSTRRRRS